MPDSYLTDEQKENERFLPLSDEEVAVLAQGGDGQALAYLLNKYKNFVRSKARSCGSRGHCAGGDDRPV